MARTQPKSPPPDAAAPSPPSTVAFSPLDNEPPVRWFKWLRLLPQDGLGAGRRALFLALLTWLPIALWAIVTGRVGAGDDAESLLQHYAVFVRCGVAIPLLVLAEPMLHRAASAIAERLAAAAVGTAPARAGFDLAIRDVTRLRDSATPWLLLIAAAVAWPLVNSPDQHDDAMAWALEASGALGFGGWWFAYVARPVFLALLLAWLWRIGLVTYWFWRIGRLDLTLVPTHPDRTGGIAFVEKLPGAFALVGMAVSAVVASRWAHELLQHGVGLATHKLAAIAFLLLWALLLLLPLLAVAPACLKARTQAIADYSALVGRQGRLVHRRWIDGESVESDPILDAPEIGPVADAAAMYEAVKKMRPIPIGMASIAKIVAPLVIPMLFVAALQIPVKELLLKLLKVLV